MQFHRLFGTAALSFLVLTNPVALANDAIVDESVWNSVKTTIAFEGTAVKPEMVDVPLDLEMITSSHEDAVGKVGFVCMDGTFKAVVASKAINLEEGMTQIWQRDQVIRGVKPRLTINGKSKSNSVWAQSNKLGVALPNKKNISAKLYNAVIRQDEVFMQMSGMKKTRLILPSSDREFANFGAECGLGLKAQKK